MHGEPLDSAALEAIVAAGSPAVRAALLVVACGAGAWLTRRDAERWPVPPLERWNILLVVFVGAAIGAALPAFGAGGVIGQVAHHGLIFGPRTIMGGLLGGFLGAAAYKRWRGIDYDTSDDFVRGTALGMAIGRLGCHAGHCCVGRAAPLEALGLDFGDGVLRLPSQLIEAAVLFGLFALFHFLHRTDRFPGRRLFLYMGAYGLVRVGLELLRAPVASVHLGLGFYQWLALALVGFAAVQVARRTPRAGASLKEG